MNILENLQGYLDITRQQFISQLQQEISQLEREQHHSSGEERRISDVWMQRHYSSAFHRQR